MTRCNTSKEQMRYLNAEDNMDEKAYLDELANSWNSRFQALETKLETLYEGQDAYLKEYKHKLQKYKNDWIEHKEASDKHQGELEENIKKKLEYFAKNISEIYGILEDFKANKSSSQSKNIEVIFARLNGFGKNIKTLSGLYKKIKEINQFCKKTIIQTNQKMNIFILGLSEMLKRGGNLELEELNLIAQDVLKSTVNEKGVGGDIKVIEYIEVIKAAFNRWKNANLQKFDEIKQMQAKDLEMVLEKLHVLHKRFS